MKGYSHSRFTAEALEVAAIATGIVDAFEDAPLVRCHEVARAVLTVLRKLEEEAGPAMRASELWRPHPMLAHARVVDGWYAGCDHSWIQLETGTILDTYAVARVPMVQLVDVGNALLQSGHYREEEERTDVLSSVVNVLVVRGLTVMRAGLHLQMLAKCAEFNRTRREHG